MVISLNWVDIGVVLILVISAVIGFIRGATREVLGIGGWIGALLITLYGLVYARHFTQPYIKNPFVCDVVTGIVLFLIALLVLSLISRHLSVRIKGSLLGSLDRSLGLTFGFVRGGVLLCFTLLIASFIWKPVNWPDTVKSARSTGYLAQGANWIRTAVPNDSVKNIGLDTNSEPIQLAQYDMSSDAMVQELSQPKPSGKK